MKLFNILLYLVLGFCAFSVETSAEIVSGAAGDNATWELDTSTGELRIYGTGATYDRHGSWTYYAEYTKYDKSGNGVDNYGVKGTQYTGSSPISAYAAKIKSVVIEEGITSIGAAFFYNCYNLQSVTMASTVELINYEAFRSCTKLESVTIGSGVTQIMGRSFTDCVKLSVIDVAEDNTSFVSIGGVLYTSDLKRLVRFPEAMNVIDYVIPEGVEVVDTDALYRLQYVQSLTIPTTLTNISYGSLDSCSNLHTLVLKSTTPPVLEKNISGTTITSVFVPCGEEAIYKSSGKWSNMSGKVKGAVVVDFVVKTSDPELGDVEVTQRADCESMEMTITAIPTVYGMFSRWQDGNTENPRKVAVEPTSATSYEYIAYFEPKPYNITVSKGTTSLNNRTVTSYYQVSVTDNGEPEVKKSTSGNAVSVTQSYRYGNVVTLYCNVTATGYKFKQWSDGNKENPRTITVTEAAAYSAVIEAGKVTIGTTPNSSDYGTTSPESKTISFGTNVAIEAIAKSGYQFLKWDDGDTNASRTITATADKTYIAYFGIKTYTITATSNNVEWGNVTGYGTFQAGKSTILTATPNEGYYFVKWNDGETSNVRTISSIDKDYNLEAEFKAYQYEIKFLDAAGSTLKSSLVDYGTMPTPPANPTKSQTDEYTYEFAGWTPEVVAVTKAATYTPTYTSTKREYTVNFVDGNGVTLQTSKVAYGVVPTYAGATPTKTATAQYTYTYSKWDKTIVAVTGDVTYTAQFNSTLNKYTITFVNDDNSTLLTLKDVVYGSTPKYTGATLVKESTSQYVYSFAAWSPNITTVTGDKTYKATYTQSVRQYTVKFVDGDGNVIQTSNVAYGTIPSYKGASEPTKTSTAEYSYTFNKKWSPTIVAVTKDVTYTAQFSQTKRSYDITFKDSDGSIIEVVSATYGSTPKCTKSPIKKSTVSTTYEFTGWSPAVVAVTGAMTYTAQYSESAILYTVNFANVDGAGAVSTVKYEYNAVPKYEGTPKKTADAKYVYEFTGWDKELVAVTENVTYTAQFKSTLRNYAIKFVNENETTEQLVAYGETPVYKGATPTKQSTEEYSYTFNGWTPNIVAVTKAATYTAQFTATKNKYTITFIGIDGKVLSSKEYEYGEQPSEPKVNIDNTAKYTYTFAGWDKKVTKVVADATYTAQVSEKLNEYKVTFKNADGTQLDSRTYVYGATPSYVGTPSQESTAEYSYSFSGWDKPIETVKEDVIYTATYSSTKRSYDINFVDDNGDKIKTISVLYGEMPVYSGAEPIKTATAQYTYTFEGWAPAITMVTGAATYKAKYSKTINEYTVNFVNYNGEVLKTASYKYGVVPTCTVVPEKESTEQYNYKFNGWSPSVVTVTEDATYVAQFVSEVRSYKITFVNYDGTTLASEMFEYGEMPTYNSTPERQADSYNTYTFKGWTPALSGVTENATYTAVYSTAAVVYNVTFNDYDGTELAVVGFDAGEELICDIKPMRESTESTTYTFEGWTPEITDGMKVTSNMSFTAKYTESTRKYTVTFLGADGTVLQQELVDYDAMPIEPTAPTKERDEQYSYVFVGWDRNIEPVYSDVTYQAMFTAVTRKYIIKFVDYDGSVIQSNELEYGAKPSCIAPERSSDVQYTYTFSGWDTPIVNVTADATYTAEYNKSLNSYVVMVNSDNLEYGYVIGGGTFYYGDEITITAIATSEGKFVRWSDGNTDSERVIMVNGDVSYTAIFAEQSNTAVEELADETTIAVRNRTIVVDTNDENTVIVYSVAGQLMYSGSGYTEYEAPNSGVYIVRTPYITRKLLLK